MFDNSTHAELHYGQHEFITSRTPLAVPVITLLTVASITGTFGNILILIVACSKKLWRHVEARFIVNLALSDLYVTLVADPMSIIGMVYQFILFEVMLNQKS